MSDVPALIDVALFAAGFVSWAISTLAAGGGSVLIVAAVAVILRGQTIAPVVTMASMLASPARMILLWRFIDWRVVRWYLPGATAAALLGGWAFAHIGTQWLQIVLALFLISRQANRRQIWPIVRANSGAGVRRIVSGITLLRIVPGSTEPAHRDLSTLPGETWQVGRGGIAPLVMPQVT